MANKKGYEIDERAWAIIMDEFSDFDKYLPTVQDQKVRARKFSEYKDKATVRIREEIIINGRSDNTATDGNN